MKKLVFLLIIIILALSNSTFAAIVYSGSQNVTLTPMQPSMTINIAGEMTEQWDDFTIVSNWYSMTMGSPSLIISSGGMGSMAPMGMGWIFGFSGMIPTGMPVFTATNFDAGELIGTQPFSSNSALLVDSGLGQFGAEGGYIGLGMDIPGGSPHYAWLRMDMDNDSFTFNGWAYESLPDTSIPAGAIPVPAAIGLGGVGIALVAWLRRRKTV